MKIKHKIIFNNSKNMKVIPSNSVDLVVTSPPYPMIKMWDDMFCSQNSSIKDALNKFSGKGDTVLDPFLGTGTTMAAAMASARNSIGYEIDQSLKDTIYGIKSSIVSLSNQYVRNRIKKYIDFVAERIQSKGSLKYINKFYRFPVITNQEKELILNDLTEIKNLDKDTMEVFYSEEPQAKNFGEQLRRCKGTKHLC